MNDPNSDDVRVFGVRDAAAHYIDRPGSYAVTFRQDGHVAVVRTSQGAYLPGGGTDAGESLIETIDREALEEAGLVVGGHTLIGRADELAFCTSQRVHYRKICRFLTAELVEEHGGGEADHELEWLSPEQAVRELAHGSQRWAVQEAVRIRSN